MPKLIFTRPRATPWPAVVGAVVTGTVGAASWSFVHVDASATALLAGLIVGEVLNGRRTR